jgi:DNA-directed RNA polymerase subunit RPC12/RpoP
MGYICRECHRHSNLPDFCHGQAMIQEGSYVCDNCGSVSQAPGTCCELEMRQV